MNKKVEFSLSILFFWIKGQLSVDSRFVKVNTANSVLGIFPAVRDSKTIPLKNISSTKLSSKYKIMPMIFGSGMLTTLVIQRAGKDYLVSVPFFEKGTLIAAQDQIEDALANDTDKTDLNHFLTKKLNLNLKYIILLYRQ